MIPVLGIPVIGRPDLLARCIASIDHPIARLVIIDNSPDGGIADGIALPAGTIITRPPSNLGYAGSINHVLRTLPDAPWWAIANADTMFGMGDLASLDAVMASGQAGWVGVIDWRVFGLTFDAVARVGLWDENFHPAYCEDADYEYRCTLAGVRWGFIPGSSTHVGSVTIQEGHYAQRNAVSYPANRAYYRAKWGGELRGGEAYSTPFGAGGDVGDWRLDIRRLRDQRW